jgi:3-(3-hydroxy-phenyl)propionate hydroxylase
MAKNFEYPKFEYVTPPEIRDGKPGHYPVVVVGAGPAGMAAATDMAQLGHPVLLLDDDETVSIGSRGLCYARRAIEVLDRLGCGDPVADKGVSWDVGRTYRVEEEVFNFNLTPEPGFERPGMVNLQQYYLEQYQITRLQALPNAEIRFRNEVVKVTPGDKTSTVEVKTPDGNYELTCDWLIVADGARSPVRHMLGLDMEGVVFKDRFLIADVTMDEVDFPIERRFWFDPVFHPNQSVLLHAQADGVWRIDFQLGWDADPVEEVKPENVRPRIEQMLGPDIGFELEWVSIYTFQCRRMADFRQGNILFVGDSAHQVSPFGARGANSGLQDTDNLCWKLDLVMRGQAPDALLDTYSDERVFAADENLLNSTRSTDFITPKSAVSKQFRNAVLDMARSQPFARKLVNSGRLSVPAFLTESRLNTAERDAFGGNMVPGAPMDDAPVNGSEWLLRHVGNQFKVMVYADDASQLDASVVAELQSLAKDEVPTVALVVAAKGQAPAGLATIIDSQGLVRSRYDLQAGSTYVLRPDQHVTARMRAFDAAAVHAAVRRACGLELAAA